jgi:hypothetical protein
MNSIYFYADYRYTRTQEYAVYTSADLQPFNFMCLEVYVFKEKNL